MKKFFQSLFLSPRLFQLLTGNILLFVLAHFVPVLFSAAVGLLATQGVALLLDLAILYRVRQGIRGIREVPEKLSNGDQNEIGIYLSNFYRFPIQVEVIDEVPVQFQRRDLSFKGKLEAGGHRNLSYELRPLKRGTYTFGNLNVLVASPLGLVRRRFRFEVAAERPCYPSYQQLRKYQLLAASNRLHEMGVKKIRRIGQSMEFEQIRNYVVGDDYRTINWKATARQGNLMVNQYTEERSQPVYCVIDKGRMMKMPFEGLSLLDYAINASLVICNIAIYKQDKAGLITFSERMGAMVKASRRPTQMNRITELLYNQKSRFLESNFEVLFSNIRRKVGQRSLMLLFTNFDSLSSMRRQLPYLRRLNKNHLLVVVFFENTELHALTLEKAQGTEAIYLKTVAEKFAFDKRQVVRELKLHGIQAILTAPKHLTINALNKYLELKARGLL